MAKKPKFKIPQVGTPPEIPLQKFDFSKEVFNDPKGIMLDTNIKELILKEIEKAYTQAWMTQKTIEITYQRFLHNDLDKGQLVEDGLKNELQRTQSEVRIAEGILDTLKEWRKIVRRQ